MSKKSIDRQNTRIFMYSDILEMIQFQIFEWNGIPENLTSVDFEKAINTGYCAFYNMNDFAVSSVNEGFQITPCMCEGVLKNNLTTDNYVSRGTDYSINITDNVNAVVGFNNDIKYNEYLNIHNFAEQLTNTDESERALIKWSKIHPIPKANTEIQLAKMQTVIKKLLDGDDNIVYSDNTRIATNSPNTAFDDVVNLTDVSAIEKMHFLSEYHTELLMRYFKMYGIPFATNSKSAQSLNDELHDMDMFSLFLNTNRLKCRKEFAEKINKKYGLNVSVDYSELIKLIKNRIETEERETENNTPVENPVESVENPVENEVNENA